MAPLLLTIADSPTAVCRIPTVTGTLNRNRSRITFLNEETTSMICPASNADVAGDQNMAVLRNRETWSIEQYK